MRKPQTKEYWVAEAKFVEDEIKERYPMGGFKNYCRMQANFAKADGFAEEANRILAVLNILEPK